MKVPKWALWVILPGIAALSTATTVLAIDTSSALYTSNILFLNLGLTRDNFAMAQPISGSALIDDGFIQADTLNAVIHEGPNQVPGMPPNNRIVVEGAVVDDGGSFTEFTAEAQDATELDAALLPPSPMVGDASYFGCDNPCRIITLDIGQEGIGDWELEWEYYNGTAFITASNVDDRTLAFTRPGQRTVSFDMPTDMATTTVTGSAVDAFWVRARVTSVSTSSQQPIANQEWYENGQWWVWGESLSINEERLYTMSVGGPDLVTNHQIFPGEAGIITPDDPTVELGDRYIVHWEGAVSFVTGSASQCLVCKGASGPFRLYVSDAATNEVTVAISGAGTTTLSISGIPEASDEFPALPPHVIDIVSDGTEVTLAVAGVGTTAGAAQDVTDTTDDYTWMSNGAAVYANKMYIFPDEIGFAATITDTEAGWDTGVVTEVVSTGGQPAFTVGTMSETAVDDGFWTEGTSAFNNTSTSTSFGYSGSGGATSQNAFYRFDNMQIEQGATITTADLQLIGVSTQSATTVNVAINGVDEDDPTAPSSYAEAEALSRTTASVAWSGVSSFALFSIEDSPDITSVIQEIVNRPGWTPGNAIVILVEDDGSTAALNTNRSASSFEGFSNAVLLQVSVDVGIFTDDFIEMQDVSTAAVKLPPIAEWATTCGGSSCNVRVINADGAANDGGVFGTHGLRLTPGSGAGTLARAQQSISGVSPGEVWSFSTRAKRFTSGGGSTANMIIRFRDSANTVLSTTTVSVSSTNVNFLAAANGITAPALTDNILFTLESTLSAGAASHDGVMAAIAPTAPVFPDTANRLLNPSFEDVFATPATWVSSTINLTQTDVAQSLAVWDSFSPYDAELVLESSIDGQASWQTLTNGESIPGIAVGDDVSGGTLNIRASFTPSTGNTEGEVFSPFMSFLAIVVADDLTEDSADIFYELRTTPGVTIEDLSPNTNDGIMSYPVQLAGIFSDQTPLVTTRTPLSQNAAIGAGEFAASVTGSASNLNLFGGDDGSFLPGGEALAQGAAAAGFPIGALWAGIVMIAGVVMGGFAYKVTAPNQLPASIVLAGTVAVAAAVGDGIIPGWVPFVTIMMLVAWNLLRSRLPI